MPEIVRRLLDSERSKHPPGTLQSFARLVEILERPAGQQLARSQRRLESASVVLTLVPSFHQQLRNS